MWKIMICGTCNKRPGIYHDLKYFTWREGPLYGPVVRNMSIGFK